MTLTACTISARHQLAQVRALAWSLRVLDPAVALFVLVVDDPTRAVEPGREPFQVIRPGSLDLSRYEILAGVHALPELVEVLRPALLRHMLDEVRGPVVSLDVDLLAYASLAPLGRAAVNHGVAVVPRLMAPVPRDHVRLTDEDVIKKGVFDQGLCAMAPGEEVDHFLRTWSDRVELDRGDEIPLAAARFLDLAPGVVDSCAIVRDAGLGVSAINLHERHLTERGAIHSNGTPLRTVHFDGIDGRRRPPADPFAGRFDGGQVSEEDRARSPEGLREEMRRHVVSRNALLARLITQRDRALKRCGLSEAAIIPYGYDRLLDGTPLNRRMRRAIRDAEIYGGLRASPFSVEGGLQLLDWCNQPAERGGCLGVTRFWFEIYRERPDLQAIHPDLDGSSAAGFLRWTIETGKTEYGAADSVMPVTIVG